MIPGTSWFRYQEKSKGWFRFRFQLGLKCMIGSDSDSNIIWFSWFRFQLKTHWFRNRFRFRNRASLILFEILKWGWKILFFGAPSSIFQWYHPQVLFSSLTPLPHYRFLFLFSNGIALSRMLMGWFYVTFKAWIHKMKMYRKSIILKLTI